MRDMMKQTGSSQTGRMDRVVCLPFDTLIRIEVKAILKGFK